MSLLTFFSEQRRYWFNQTKEWPLEHVDGGLAARLKAEVAFMTQPMYNVHLQLVKVQQELESLTYKASQARKDHEMRITHHAEAVVKHKAQIEAYKLLEKRAGKARQTLKQLQKVADLDEFEPEVRLRYMQQLMKQYFDLTQPQAAAEDESEE